MIRLLAALACCAALAAAELPAGRYRLSYAEVGAETLTTEVLVARDGDAVVVTATTGPTDPIAGRLLGDRLRLLRSAITADGMEVLQVVAALGEDGFASGTAWTSLDAKPVTKKNFVLKRIAGR